MLIVGCRGGDAEVPGRADQAVALRRRRLRDPVVAHDDSVEFAQVARAIDIMRGSGIDSVGLITAKIEAGQ